MSQQEVDNLLIKAAKDYMLGNSESYDMAKDALERWANVDARDETGQTALHYAILRDRWDIVELLVNADANPNIQDNSGETPLTVRKKQFAGQLLDMIGVRTNAIQAVILEQAMLGPPALTLDSGPLPEWIKWGRTPVPYKT